MHTISVHSNKHNYLSTSPHPGASLIFPILYWCSDRVWAGWPGFESWQGKEFSHLYNVQTSCGAHPFYNPIGTRGDFAIGGGGGVKRSGHETDYSSLSSAKVKNDEALLPPYIFMG
jgi:hypothetical protein